MNDRIAASPEATKRPRGRRSKDAPDGQQALLKAAIYAFATHGFDAADVRSIAAAADVAPNLVRVHFGNKAALWEACLEAMVNEIAPVIADLKALTDQIERPLGERLRELFMRVMDFYADHSNLRDFVARLASETPERAALLTDRLLRPAYEAVRPLFAAGIEAGLIRGSHPAVFFSVFVGAINQPSAFPVLLNRMAPEIDPTTARAQLAETIIAILLHLPAPAPATPFVSHR